ncbi:MAG: dihydroneopterin aldolase [Acidimicrobiales bacterium]
MQQPPSAAISGGPVISGESAISGGPVFSGAVTSIAVDGIRVLGRHGLTSEERERAQPFEIDVLVTLNGSHAHATDGIADTVDYGEIVAIAVEVLEGPSHRLLESLAGSIVGRLRNEYGDRVGHVAVTVRKLYPPIAYHVNGVRVTVEMPGKRQ